MKRISALLLAALMTLSMSSFAFEDVFAASDGVEEQPGQITDSIETETDLISGAASDAVAAEQGDTDPEPSGGGEDPDPSGGGEAPDPSGGGETPDPSGGGEDPDPSGGGENPDPSGGGENPDPSGGGENPDPSGGTDVDPADQETPPDEEPAPEPVPEPEPAPEPVPEPAPEMKTIAVTVAENLNGTMTLTWDPVEGASTYTVTKESCSAYIASMIFYDETASVDTTQTSCTFTDLFPGRLYTYRVIAKDSSGAEIGQTAEPVSLQPVLSAVTKSTRVSRSVDAKKVKINGSKDFRKKIGEPYNGYSVVQGGCTDGTYAYYLMVSPYNQHGRVVKVNMASRTIVKVSDVLDTWHGNGMAYDSRRHELVVNARNEGSVKRKQELTCIDADTLTIVPGRQKKVSYKYFKDDDDYFDSHERSKGFANVTYNEKYDVYICLQRTNHNFIVVDPDSFRVMGLIMTTVNAKYPGNIQAADCDDQYMYQLMSENGKKQPYNLILAFDWNAAKLVDKNGHRREYVSSTWKAANKKKPVAVYRVNTPNEAENIYHVTDSSGQTHFYMSEYNRNFKYIKEKYKVKKKVKWKKVTKKVKKKVKWKKVKKKVKWKKVKTKSGKYKWKYKTKKVWKYKYKTVKKKVWKYKYKYKTKYRIVGSFYDRLAHVYDLGIL